MHLKNWSSDDKHGMEWNMELDSIANSELALHLEGTLRFLGV